MSSFSESNINRAQDGKFAAKTTGETRLNLDATPAHTPTYETVSAADGAELDAYVHHPDVVVRVAAASNPNLTDAHIQHLSDAATQPPVVRFQVARTGANETLIDDPSPTVRAFARASYFSGDRVQYDRSSHAVAATLGLHEPAHSP